MNIFALISLLILALYVFKIQKYRLSWERYPELKPSASKGTTKISVIIAFRNEISNLPALLTSLNKQAYPKGLYEVILVNDHSNDGSEILAHSFCEEHGNFQLLHLGSEATGKKSAITKGIKNASFELIVTSDADCTMNAYWLATIDHMFQEKNPDMMVGLVDIISNNSFFGKFQEVEFLSLVAAGAGAVAGQNPIYCNGACLAYKKSLFIHYTDPMKQTVVSGDDTLFMLTVKRDLKNSIVLLKAVPAIVVTKGVATWREFMQQRKRWVSKSRYYRDVNTLYTALLVCFVNLSVLYSLTMLVMGRNFWLLPLIYGGKMLTDLYFLRRFFHFYKKKLPSLRFMLYELIYPFYTVFFTIAGVSSGFRWKGRRFGPAE